MKFGSRLFYGVEDVAPANNVTIAMTGDVAQSNRLTVGGSNTLNVSGSFIGLPYYMGEPAMLPGLRMGFKKGDKVLLEGALGTEPNHGRLLTISLAAGFLNVYETLTTPDANEYTFTLVRQSLNGAMTEHGRDLMSRLVTLATVGDPDVPESDLRARWTGVGEGTQPEGREVVRLVSPLTCLLDGSYVKVLDAGKTDFPVLTSVRLCGFFDVDEITHTDPGVIFSEAGLYFDSSLAAVIDPMADDSIPAFYKTFEPLTKLDSFTMKILWNLQF